MKKLIILLMIVLLLAGCSGRKNDDPPTAEKPTTTIVDPVAKDPYEEYYGTWRTSGISTNGVRFDMEQVTALGGDSIDLIFIFNKDGTVYAYSPYYDQTEEEKWTKEVDSDSIVAGDVEFFIEENELVMNVNEGKLYLAKISEREDRDYLDELLEEINKQEETKPSDEPEPDLEPEKDAVSENTIRPEVKEAIDAYEAFIDEYCEFMKKYSESDGTDLSILSDYLTFMSKLEDYSDKMDAMEDDLTDAEYWYYIEVLNRCNEKMLKAAS